MTYCKREPVCDGETAKNRSKHNININIKYLQKLTCLPLLYTVYDANTMQFSSRVCADPDKAV